MEPDPAIRHQENTMPTPPKLPEPIKPRRLLRRETYGGGFDYITSDGRYEVYPQYKDRPNGGRTNTVEQWVITDLNNPDWSRSYPRLDDVRYYHCAPGGNVPWLVCDMDRGVLRVAESKAAAVAWASSHACAPLRERRYTKGSGCYDYEFGEAGDDANTCVFIMRADDAENHGFDPVQQPWYPYPDEPHTDGPRALAEYEAA